MPQNSMGVARALGDVSYATVWRVAQRKGIDLAAGREAKGYKRLPLEQWAKVEDAVRAHPGGDAGRALFFVGVAGAGPASTQWQRRGSVPQRLDLAHAEILGVAGGKAGGDDDLAVVRLQLARKTGVSRSTLGRVVRGRRDVPAPAGWRAFPEGGGRGRAGWGISSAGRNMAGGSLSSGSSRGAGPRTES